MHRAIEPYDLSDSLQMDTVGRIPLGIVHGDSHTFLTWALTFGQLVLRLNISPVQFPTQPPDQSPPPALHTFSIRIRRPNSQSANCV